VTGETSSRTSESQLTFIRIFAFGKIDFPSSDKNASHWNSILDIDQ
jgi:hypothetical protein